VLKAGFHKPGPQPQSIAPFGCEKRTSSGRDKFEMLCHWPLLVVEALLFQVWKSYNILQEVWHTGHRSAFTRIEKHPYYSNHL